MDAAARRRTYDIPKSDSVGLAEWTTKIKALQRQVDEDEEAETRRLEEEIMVSRMSRMRRSTLQSRPSSHDLSVNNLPRVASPISDVDRPQSAEDKQRDREATMRKLMGQWSPVPPDSPRSKTPLDNPPPTQPKPSKISIKPRQEPTSLAALMGSQETGPRMNKHAPQQDAHDPTQFERGRSATSPHPVFGKSGVAMPGLVPKSPLPQSRPSPRSADIGMASPSAPFLNLRERKISTPAVARRYVEKIESESPSKPSPSPRIRDTRERIRERTMSTPSHPGPGSRGRTTPSKPPSSGAEPTVVNKQLSPMPQAHSTLSTPSTPNLHRHSYTPGSLSNETKPDSPRKTFPFLAQPGRTEPEVSSRSESPTLPVPTSNLRQSPSMPSTSPSRQTAVINTQTLARPVEQKPKPSLRGPTIVSYNRSPAFAERSSPKGATPSLSRLQGRGFVQNMVKVSAELESSTGSSPFPTPERARSEPQKRVSVLDRWTGTESAVSTPVDTPSPVPMRKAKTLDPVNATKSASPGVPQPSRSITAPKRKSQTFEKEPDISPPLSKSPSKGILVTSKEKEKSIPATPPVTLTERVRGVGSSNTLVSYIKPVKTGDSEPPSPVRSKTPTANDGTDELGVRKRKSSGKLREKSVSFAASPPRSKAKSVADVLPSPSKPLSHPTKDRVKKPKRVKITTATIREDKGKQSGPISQPKILPNVAGSDSLKPPSASSGPTLSAPDLSPPSPTALPQPSNPSSRRPHTVSVRLSKSRSPSPQPPAQSSSQAIPSEERFLPPTRQKVADKWANGPIIGVKPIANGRENTASISTSPLPTPTGGNFGKIALPGLSEARTPSPRSTDKVGGSVPSSPVHAKEPSQEKPRKRNDGGGRSGVDKPQLRRPPVPQKPSRIPSTGNRATVMDVAQVWSEHEKQSSQDAPSPQPTSPISPIGSHPLEAPTEFGRQREPGDDRECGGEGQEQVEALRVDFKPATPGWGTQASVSEPSAVEEKDAYLKLPDLLNPTEKKKLSWEKYSELIMPALEEEWTPDPSPMQTLNKVPTVAAETEEEQVVAVVPAVKGPTESKVDYIPIDLLSVTLNPERETVKVSPTDLVTFDFPGYAAPNVDVRSLLKSIPQPALADPGVITVSVDVLSIVGSTAGTISNNTSVFYDTEILAVVQRAKVKSSGLVDTKVWGWVGKDAKVGPKEEKALGDLAKRYGTELVPVKQYHEPADMVTVLGGTLITRQGTRAHWSSENTTMHLVRSANGVTFIDEQQLSVQNLCSGFSYCLSILQIFYVWNGRGARFEERKAAFDYAVYLCGDADGVIVLDEGENDEDEMFWAVLGDGDREYAKASHWSWRAGANAGDPQMWRISASDHQFIHIAVNCIPSLDDGVFILDAVWEIFVLVGTGARGKRQDIGLALKAAKALVSFVETSRPFLPPVHVLVLPSQIPQDLRLAVRDPGFGVQGDGLVEHMNILSLPLALDHLNASKWHKVVLYDKTLLPLGLSPHDFH